MVIITYPCPQAIAWTHYNALSKGTINNSCNCGGKIVNTYLTTRAENKQWQGQREITEIAKFDIRLYKIIHKLFAESDGNLVWHIWLYVGA